ncbi:MAG: hypothetical protein ACKV0T_19875, partial [Planctomycetales bacterium]
RRQQRQFAAGEIQARDVGPSLRAWLAHCQGANSRAITRILLRKLTLHRSPLPPPDPCQSHFARLSESCPRCNERGERRHKR